MGEFRSGTWIISGVLYFFVLFIITFFGINAANEVGIDATGVTFVDPGFQNQQPIDGSKCVGTITPFCGSIPASTMDIDRCNSIPGCTFSVNRVRCEGQHGVEDCGTVTNSTLCLMVGCTIVSGNTPVTEINSGSSIGTIRETVSFITGFRADLGLPPAFQFIFSFMFFWIPFFIFIWAIYMALPIIH